MTARALTPVDLSDAALFTEDRWREPFAQLRAEAPVSWREDSAYGGYWSVVTHDLIQQVELDPATYSSQLGNITIAEGVAGSEFPNFIAMDPPRHTEQRRVVAAAFTPSQMLHRERQVKERTRELLDSLPIGETFCWVNQVAVPLTIGMLAIVLDFKVKNDALTPRTETILASVPFPESAYPASQLSNLVVSGYQTAWLPLQYWADGSLKIAQAQFTDTLAAGETKTYRVARDEPATTGSFTRNTWVAQFASSLE